MSDLLTPKQPPLYVSKHPGSKRRYKHRAASKPPPESRPAQKQEPMTATERITSYVSQRKGPLTPRQKRRVRQKIRHAEAAAARLASGVVGGAR